MYIVYRLVAITFMYYKRNCRGYAQIHILMIKTPIVLIMLQNKCAHF